ncbi:hypothetical protein J7F03_10540 [Streptomyces sp. ISL-43]|uniref:hypothetical protein n=1 Tax=Streptomyces sp. ISL-43 TaxID=2819183 RepID=UPI001BE64DD9|nr:hypothetical protein [Streptomyces sp. ISL-43]MBT2447505.1 hypothetical protein [Streptomyces sp. ISL-43]
MLGDDRLDFLDSLVMAVNDGNDGTLPLSAVRGVPISMPADVLVLAALGSLGIPVFLAGGGLGIAWLVARRRAAEAARNAAAAGPGHMAWSYEAAASD